MSKPPSPRFIVSGILATPRIAQALEARFDFKRWRGENHDEDLELSDFLSELHHLVEITGPRQRTTQQATIARQPEQLNTSMSTAQAAARLEITEDAVRAAIRRGRIPAERRGQRIVIAEADILTYRASRRS